MADTHYKYYSASLLIPKLVTSVFDTTSLNNPIDTPMEQKIIFHSLSHTPQRPNFQRHHTARESTEYLLDAFRRSAQR